MYFYKLPRDIASVVAEGNDRINHLEKRHKLIIKWLEHQVKANQDLIKPASHPLDFAMHTSEEAQQAIWTAEWTNRLHSVAASAYETVLEAIENGDRQMAEAQFKKDNPCNEYMI
jgi:hypothetical protein